MNALFLIGLGLLISSLAVFLWFLESYNNRKLFRKLLNYRLLLVKIPKKIIYEKEAKEPGLTDICINFENFIINLSEIKYPIVFEVAVPIFEEEIFFYIAVPKENVDFVSKLVQSSWPGSEVEEVLDDYTIFTLKGFSKASYLKLSNHEFLPIRTYLEFAQISQNVDTLDSIIGAFSKVAKENEGLSLQIIFKKAPKSINKKIEKVAKKMKEGKSFSKARSSDFFELISDLFTFESEEKKEKKKIEEERKPKEEKTIQALENKASRPLFYVNIRMVAFSLNEKRTEELISSLENSFHHFSNPPLNDFKIIRVSQKNLIDFVTEWSFRKFNSNYKMLLSSQEIATIFHFPSNLTKISNIYWLKSRTAPPPVNLPFEGIILGKASWRGEEREVRLKMDDRRRHIYVIGQTGTGKTTFLLNMIYQDIVEGRGVCFIDPHGDAAARILHFVPKERIDDVIYFNPGDLEFPIGVNMLEYDPNFVEQKTFIVNELLEIIDKIYNLRETGGPIFEQFFRNALYLLMDDPEFKPTLLEVPRVFADDDFRLDLIDRCQNPVVKQFWTKEAPRVGGELSFDNIITYITSKLNPFVANDFIRPIIAQQESSINFRKIMDEGKIFIVNLSKGRLGEINSYLLGMIIVGKILMAAFSRMDIPEEQRKDFYLYIDEFQNVTTNTISQILSEARKYRLSLIIAHQYIAQLSENIRDAVFGNVGTIVSFRVGIPDAEFLEKQFAPQFSKTDLISIENFNAYLRLMIDGYVSDPFNIKILPPQKGSSELVDLILKISRLKYGKPRKLIEEEIRERYGL